MHITSRGLRFVDVGIIYHILAKVVLQISFTHYGNILAHNTALFTRGNSGLPHLNSSRKSSDIPLATQSPIWVNPMGPITLSFGEKCYNVTTPGDNMQISSTKCVFILTAQAQVTASGIFPWSDWSTLSADRYSCQRNSFSAESARAACTQWSAWRCALFGVNKPSNKNRTTPAWQLDHVNPAYSLKRHIMRRIMIMTIKIMTAIIIRIIIVTIIIRTIMALSCNHGYHWRDGCPEMNYVCP